jgi:hypothetical protein
VWSSPTEPPPTGLGLIPLAVVEVEKLFNSNLEVRLPH